MLTTGTGKWLHRIPDNARWVLTGNCVRVLRTRTERIRCTITAGMGMQPIPRVLVDVLALLLLIHWTSPQAIER